MKPGAPSRHLATITDALDAVLGRPKPAPGEDQPTDGRRPERVESVITPPLDVGTSVERIRVLPPEPVVESVEPRGPLLGAPRVQSDGPPERVQTAAYTVKGIVQGASVQIIPASSLPREVSLIFHFPAAANLYLSPDSRQDPTGFRVTNAIASVGYPLVLTTQAPVYAYLADAVGGIEVSVWIEPRR